MSRSSLWPSSASLPVFGPLPGDRVADVVVAGGGVAGVTAALLLRRAGRKVLVVEAARCGGGETGRTTAHLTELLDARYHALESKMGAAGARAAAEASRAAIARVESFAGELGAGRCAFARVPGYLVAAGAEQRAELEQELDALRRVGAEAAWADVLPFPVPGERALRIERQAQVHPLAYLAGLLERLVAEGGEVYEQTRLLDVEDGSPCRVVTSSGRLVARDVLVLTNHPVSSRFALHTKIAAYRTYAIAAGPLPRGRLPAALLWDLEDPYHYLRTHDAPDGTWLVAGGEDHKTGQERETAARFAALERYLAAVVPDAPVRHRWSGQIIEPSDGLPFVGPTPAARHVFVGTGFSGTGMTFGTLAAMILADLVTGAANPWAGLLDARRIRPLAAARRFLAENVDYPTTLARDRIHRGDADGPDEVPPGEGRLVRSGGRMLAVSRDADGTLRCRSAVCPHLGCHVQWNQAERSWDCPCHGSRFDPAGAVLNGPAVDGLAEQALPATAPAPPHADR